MKTNFLYLLFFVHNPIRISLTRTLGQLSHCCVKDANGLVIASRLVSLAFNLDAAVIITTAEGAQRDRKVLPHWIHCTVSMFCPMDQGKRPIFIGL